MDESYASSSDVEDRLSGNLPESETIRLHALLTDASLLVDAYCRRSFRSNEDDDPPAAIVAVTAAMVARVVNQPSGLMNAASANAGPYGVNFVPGSTSGGPWLSATDKLILKPFRRGGGAQSVPVVGARTDLDAEA